MNRWMQTAQPQFLGELFNQKGGDAQCNRHVTTSEAAPTVQSAGAATDVCRNRSRGNTESAQAFQAIKDRLTEREQEVYEVILEYPRGLTAEEVADRMGVSVNTISGRCSSLKFKGKVCKFGTRTTRSGCHAAVLKAV